MLVKLGSLGSRAWDADTLGDRKALDTINMATNRGCYQSHDHEVTMLMIASV
jgi:hypothetical protein